MPRKRIHELAKEWGMETRQVLAKLEEVGSYGKKAKSILTDHEIALVRPAAEPHEALQSAGGEEKLVAERIVTEMDQKSGHLVTAREEVRESRIRHDAIRRRVTRVEMVPEEEVPSSELQQEPPGAKLVFNLLSIGDPSLEPSEIDREALNEVASRAALERVKKAKKEWETRWRTSDETITRLRVQISELRDRFDPKKYSREAEEEASSYPIYAKLRRKGQVYLRQALLQEKIANELSSDDFESSMIKLAKLLESELTQEIYSCIKNKNKDLGLGFTFKGKDTLRIETFLQFMTTYSERVFGLEKNEKNRLVEGLETIKNLRTSATHSLATGSVSNADYEHAKEILLGASGNKLGLLDRILQLKDNVKL